MLSNSGLCLTTCAVCVTILVQWQIPSGLKFYAYPNRLLLCTLTNKQSLLFWLLYYWKQPSKTQRLIASIILVVVLLETSNQNPEINCFSSCTSRQLIKKQLANQSPQIAQLLKVNAQGGSIYTVTVLRGVKQEPGKLNEGTVSIYFKWTEKYATNC